MSEDAAPLVYGHEWDLPAGPREGPGAALRVPISEGPASLELADVDESHTDLMRAEPPTEPLDYMEFGTDEDDPETFARLHQLDRDIHGGT